MTTFANYKNNISFLFLFVFCCAFWSLTGCNDKDPYADYYFSPFNTKGKDTIKTASGMKYIIVSKGDGKKAYNNAKITVEYSVFLAYQFQLLATTFMSGGDPVEMVLSQSSIIQGLYEGIMLMQEGDQFRIIIPYKLGYGSDYGPTYSTATVPPYSDLIYDVELVKVE
jgi:FKBP-type peptidyl-prolyl cis-trans isomerase